MGFQSEVCCYFIVSQLPHLPTTPTKPDSLESHKVKYRNREGGSHIETDIQEYRRVLEEQRAVEQGEQRLEPLNPVGESWAWAMRLTILVY